MVRLATQPVPGAKNHRLVARVARTVLVCRGGRPIRLHHEWGASRSGEAMDTRGAPRPAPRRITSATASECVAGISCAAPETTVAAAPDDRAPRGPTPPPPPPRAPQ